MKRIIQRDIRGRLNNKIKGRYLNQDGYKKEFIRGRAVFPLGAFILS
jgi:hypothetical protein